MLKKSLFVVFVVLVASQTDVLGQCVDLLLPVPASNGDPQYIEKKKDPDAELEKKYSHILAKLSQNVKFKVSLDNQMDGGYSKTNDYVTFTTLENVYGVGEITEYRAVLKNGNAEKESVYIRKRCAIIPTGTKIYATVDHANSRYPFYIGGKGKLFVTVDRLKLDNGIDNNGVEVSLSFVKPPSETNPDKGIVRRCKRDRDRKCVVGRREKLKVATPALGAGAAAGLLLVNNGNSDESNDAIGGIAALTFLESLSKASGVDELVNPPNAKLNSNLIFDVTTEGISVDKPLKIWVPLAPKEEKKKEEGDGKKP